MIDMANKFIFADTDKCIGCLNCELACAASHKGISLDEAYDLGLKGKKLISRNTVVKIEEITAPMQCMQCENAPCVKACPINIIQYEKDYVKIYEEDCIGCRSCAMVCPFGAVIMSPSNTGTKSGLVAIKCDLCGGEEGKQACISVCPMDALKLVDYNKYKIEKQEKAFKGLYLNA
jgi:Fe-S-cluster-containing hydrogenase component 2